MNSALKLHQKLFLKVKKNKKKGPSTLEKLLTPFTSDRIANGIEDQKQDPESESDQEDRDSSDMKDKLQQVKKTVDVHLNE